VADYEVSSAMVGLQSLQFNNDPKNLGAININFTYGRTPGNCPDQICLLKAPGKCLDGKINMLLNNLNNITDFTNNINFFLSFKDASGNSIFDLADVVGFMSMHSLGGVNGCSGNESV